jgi:hypothetical protein
MKSWRASAPILRFVAAVLALLLPQPARSYEYPLTESSIRDAYYLGTKAGTLGSAFLADYTHTLPQLKFGACTSEIHLETPYTQVAIHTAKQTNYSAQHAVQDFLNKPTVFRIRLDLCYQENAPPNGIKLKILQDRKTIPWTSESRAPYLPPADESARVGIFGERIDLEFPAAKISSSNLTFEIELPDSRHLQEAFPLDTLR